MTEICINDTLCKRCGMCVKVCPMEVFEQNGKGEPVVVAKEELCILCGQCMAICGQSAHTHSEIERSKIIEFDKQELPAYQNVMALIKSRRSVRNFKDLPVEKEKIRQIIEAARFAPSAENLQSTKYLVLQDKSIIDEIAKLTADFYTLRNEGIRDNLAGKEPAEVTGTSLKNIDVILNAFNNNIDRFAFASPCIIFFYSKIGISYSEVSTNLAIQNAMLAAHSLGLGSFYTGYIVSFCQKDKIISELLGIPEGFQIYGALALGYPKIKFSKYIERNTPEIFWS